MAQATAIQTIWKGHRFRSRLEARWAVFFNTLGIRWEYEPEGFVIGWHDEDRRGYLPDFRITMPNGAWYWVEVKGNPDYFRTEHGEWFWDAIDWDGGPPGFHDCFDDPHRSGAILLFGDVPHDSAAYLEVAHIIHHKGVWLDRAILACQPALELVSTQRGLWGGIPQDFQSVSFGPGVTPISRALDAAKGARFEHGEVPA